LKDAFGAAGGGRTGTPVVDAALEDVKVGVSCACASIDVLWAVLDDDAAREVNAATTVPAGDAAGAGEATIEDVDEVELDAAEDAAAAGGAATKYVDKVELDAALLAA